MKFRKNNRIKYGQDHRFCCGVPAGVDFEVCAFRGASPGMFTLTACGHGCLERHAPDCYGNGSLYVYGLTARQRRRFEEAAKEER